MQSIANLVNELTEGYEFYIFCSNTDLHGLPLHITETDRWCSYNAWTKVWYAGKADRSKNLVRQVEVVKPGRLFIIGLFDWHFNLVPLFFCRQVNKVLSVRGMLHPGALSQKPGKKKSFLQLMKWLGLPNRTVFHATDETEAGYIFRQFGAGSIIYEAGNFPRQIGAGPVNAKTNGLLRLVSIGIVSPMKNTLLVLQALGKCSDTIHYDIFGPVKDTTYWDHCLQEIKLLPSNIKVRYHKEITPDQVPGKLYESHVFIMPSKSENFGHAIYEAMNAGLPVITSNFTPWTELKEHKAGINLPTETQEIAKAISFFAAMGQENYDQWRAGALAYAENAVDEEKLRKAYGVMFGGKNDE